jgi:hypothetical protein
MPRKGHRTLTGRWAQIQHERRVRSLVALQVELRNAISGSKRTNSSHLTNQHPNQP